MGRRRYGLRKKIAARAAAESLAPGTGMKAKKALLNDRARSEGDELNAVNGGSL
jgi:hypothetical protein